MRDRKLPIMERKTTDIDESKNKSRVLMQTPKMHECDKCDTATKSKSGRGALSAAGRNSDRQKDRKAHEERTCYSHTSETTVIMQVVISSRTHNKTEIEDTNTRKVVSYAENCLPQKKC